MTKETMIKVLEYKADHIKTKIKPQFFRDVAMALKERELTGHWEPTWYDGYEHNGLQDTLTDFRPGCGAKMIEP